MNQNTSVPVGPSEYLALFTVLSTLLIAFFGHDWGIGAQAQAFAGLAAGLVSLGTSLARAIKHHALHAAAAATYVAQLGNAMSAVGGSGGGVSPTLLANAVSTLQGAVPAVSAPVATASVTPPDTSQMPTSS